MDELYEDKDEEDIDEDLEDDDMNEEDEYNSIDDEEEYAEDDLSDLTILNEDELDGEQSSFFIIILYNYHWF